MRFLCISHFTTHHKQLLHYWTNVNRRQLIVKRDIVRSIHNDSDEWYLETGESFHVLILTTINYLAFVKTKTYFGRIIEFFLKWARFIKKGGKKRRNEKNKKKCTHLNEVWRKALIICRRRMAEFRIRCGQRHIFILPELEHTNSVVDSYVRGVIDVSICITTKAHEKGLRGNVLTSRI